MRKYLSFILTLAVSAHAFSVTLWPKTGLAGESASEAEIQEALESGTASLEEVGRQLSNPVGSVWNPGSMRGG